MKVAILSESDADQAALRILVNGLLGQSSDLFTVQVRPSGWSDVFRLLPAALSELHFNAPDVDGLVVVVDSDLTTPHLAGHDQPGTGDPNCRPCRLRQEVQRIRGGLAATGRVPIKFASGLAIPCIEAWFRCGRDNAVTEAAWNLALREKKFPYDCRRLKRAIYGTDLPTRSLERDRMVAEATRLASNLTALETWFPNGFGPFAADVRGWLT